MFGRTPRLQGAPCSEAALVISTPALKALSVLPSHSDSAKARPRGASSSSRHSALLTTPASLPQSRTTAAPLPLSFRAAAKTRRRRRCGPTRTATSRRRPSRGAPWRSKATATAITAGSRCRAEGVLPLGPTRRRTRRRARSSPPACKSKPRCKAAALSYKHARTQPFFCFLVWRVSSLPRCVDVLGSCLSAFQCWSRSPATPWPPRPPSP